jgi:hypothetical protein
VKLETGGGAEPGETRTTRGSESRTVTQSERQKERKEREKRLAMVCWDGSVDVGGVRFIIMKETFGGEECLV